jgi:RHS repeat-associated protein
VRAGRSCRGRGLRRLRLPAKSAQAARRNHDGDGSFSDAGTLRWWHLTDAQFSTIANLDDAATLQERVMYDSYGRALHRDDKDVDGDRDFDSTDRGIVNTLASVGPAGTLITASTYDADADLDRDGDVDNTDLTLIGTSYVSALAAGKLSNTTVENTVGWDGYVFNGEVSGAGLYHVRFRWYDVDHGRWLERDPVGYFDGMNVYLTSGGAPTRFLDPLGLLKQGTAEDIVKSLFNQQPKVEPIEDSDCAQWILNHLRNKHLVDAGSDLGVGLIFTPIKALPGANLLTRLGISAVEEIFNAIRKGANEEDILEMIQKVVGEITPKEADILRHLITDFVKTTIGDALGETRLVERGKKSNFKDGSGGSIECVFIVTAETRKKKLFGFIPMPGEVVETWTLVGTCKYTCKKSRYQSCPCGCDRTISVRASGGGRDEWGEYEIEDQEIETID